MVDTEIKKARHETKQHEMTQFIPIWNAIDHAHHEVVNPTIGYRNNDQDHNGKKQCNGPSHKKALSW